MNTLLLPLAARVVCLAAALVPAASAAPPARPDPFLRPNLAPESAVEAAPAPAAAWRPPLRAIVLAGERSMVKIGAVVVELGEELDGYRLVRVAEDKAVFARGRERVELTMARERAAAP